MAKFWNIGPVEVAYWGGSTYIENIPSFIAKGIIQMLWISETNPLVRLSNLERVCELLAKDSLFDVARDNFITKTAAIPGVVLHAAQWAK